jgi:hypothetical protein
MMQAQFVTDARMPTTAFATTESFFTADVVFRKTIAGHYEFDHRRLVARVELRRLLIMIDGKRTAQSLAPCFRSGELPKLLSELEALGLIESVNAPASFLFTTAEEAIEAQESLTPSQFDAVRTTAIYAATELLGAIAKPYCVALAMCKNSARLRNILAEVHAQLDATLGHDAVSIFFATVRDAATTRQHS